MARGVLAPDRKKGALEGRILAFIDEAGFYLLPAAVTTYAPVGETPILREVVTHDHLSAISAVTPAGALPTDTNNVSIKQYTNTPNLTNIGKSATNKDTAKYRNR